MYARYIGKRCSIHNTALLDQGVKIYGETTIGEHTFIDENVVIGYPTRAKILKILEVRGNVSVDEYFDEVSSGAFVGARVVIRSGTVVYEGVVVESGVEIGHNVVIRERSVIGSGCRIGTATVIDGDAVIGKNTVIQTGVYIPPGVRIGNNVFIAPRAVFTNDRYPPSRRLAETVVEDDVVVGANATITPGIVLGRGCVVAAGSVVTKSVKPYTVVAGVPAKPVMDRDEYERRRKAYEESYVFPYR